MINFWYGLSLICSTTTHFNQCEKTCIQSTVKRVLYICCMTLVNKANNKMCSVNNLYSAFNEFSELLMVRLMRSVNYFQYGTICWNTFVDVTRISAKHVQQTTYGAFNAFNNQLYA